MGLASLIKYTTLTIVIMVNLVMNGSFYSNHRIEKSGVISIVLVSKGYNALGLVCYREQGKTCTRATKNL